MERRLAAILAADVVGFSRLTEADEEAAVRALRACREVVDGLVAEHGGRVFGSAGDSVVAEFPSPVEALRCAVDIQRALEAGEADLPEERRMRLRIGVNLGDVIVEGGDLLGDGVNIAARLQALAEPGGICLSHPVFEQVRKPLDLGYEDLGERAVKNIAEPLRVYRVLTAPEAAGKLVGRTARSRLARKTLAVVAIVIVGLAGALAWLRPWEPALEPASLERMAFPLPERPSLAVLPFDDLGAEAGQAHLADGLTEDIITALSQVSSLFVIARQSSFAYDGKAVKVQQVAEELGVRYVLDGSVQRSGERLRISAQLVDALGGRLLWAERYDRDMVELFDLQDEIADRIVLALRVKLTEGEEARLHRRHTRSLEAWKLLSRGKEHLYRSNAADNAAARALFERAIESDRGYAPAYALLASAHWQAVFHGWSADRELAFEQVSSLAEEARALDEGLPDVYALQAAIHLFRRDYEAAVEAGEKAVAIDPNHATNRATLAMVLHNAGRPEEAIRAYRTAMRLSPYYPAWFLEDLGFAYLAAEQPEEALLAFEEFLAREPAAVHVAHAHIGRALAHYLLGREPAARAEVAAAREADAGITIAGFRALSLGKDRARLERGLEILQKLGLPP